MKVGFIGAGRMATTIGRHFIGAGHEVVLSSSRGPKPLAGLVADLGPAASAGSKQEVAECDVVILATNWADAPEALKGIDWRGRILVDGTNAHMGEKPDISAAGVARSVAALEGRTSSETVAAMAPGARLVKSISNMPMAWIQDFSPQKPMPRRSWSNLSIRLAWSRSTSALSRTAVRCNSSAALYPLLNCTSSAGSFGKKNLSRVHCECAN
jgi:8-hydroxy-5-deazaflavin:NADPH oxidoreductase